MALLIMADWDSMVHVIKQKRAGRAFQTLSLVFSFPFNSQQLGQVF